MLEGEFYTIMLFIGRHTNMGGFEKVGEVFTTTTHQEAILCDIDGDGADDLVVYTSNTVAWYKQEEPTTKKSYDFFDSNDGRPISPIQAGGDIRNLYCVDIDNDGRNDIVSFSNIDVFRVLAVTFNDELDPLAGSHVLAEDNIVWNRVVLASTIPPEVTSDRIRFSDIDGDGKLDLTMSNHVGAVDTYFHIDGRKRAFHILSSDIETACFENNDCRARGDVTIGDFDGDGKEVSLLLYGCVCIRYVRVGRHGVVNSRLSTFSFLSLLLHVFHSLSLSSPLPLLLNACI